MYIRHFPNIIILQTHFASISFSIRLTIVEELAKATNKKLTQGVGEFGKAMAAAKDEATKIDVVILICHFSSPSIRHKL